MNYMTHQRGTICVERKVQGTTMWLAIQNQANYREWVGCFSIL